MPSAAEQQRNRGAWLLAISAVIAVVVALYDYLIAWGINHTIGTAIVLGSTVIMAVASLALALWWSLPRWLWLFLVTGIAIDIVGTAVAAYFLAAYVLLALMVLAAVGWGLTVFTSSHQRRAQPA